MTSQPVTQDRAAKKPVRDTTRRRSPASSLGAMDGAGRRALAGTLPNESKYHTLESFSKRLPKATTVAVCDGRQLLGFVLGEPRRPYRAFNPDQRLIGCFPTRKAAIAAVSAAEPGVP